MEAHVIKVGGENASDLRTAEWIGNYHGDHPNIAVAISALRTKSLKTTDELLKAQKAFTEYSMREARVILDNLNAVHIETLQDAGMYSPELGEILRSLYESYFPYTLEQESPVELEQRFIGYGEVMSAHVLGHILSTKYHVRNSILSTVSPSSEEKQTLSEALREGVGQQVDALFSKGVVIVPGYVSVANKSILRAYGRGYTDKMAERIAVGLSDIGYVPTLHIQKQVPLLSSHPGNIEGTKVIPSMSHWTAAEITGARGANAQVLNEHTISSDLSNRDIPVWVYNPFEEEGMKSVISRTGNPNSGILFVDGRDHVSTLTISGFAMSGAGLLAQLTQLFVEEGISIDSISSSETEVTFTAYGEITDEKKELLAEKLENSLGQEYTVDIKNNLGLIYCIGDNLSGNPGLLGRITTILAEEGIDIECVTQSRGQRAVTIGVPSVSLKKGVQALHDILINTGN